MSPMGSENSQGKSVDTWPFLKRHVCLPAVPIPYHSHFKSLIILRLDIIYMLFISTLSGTTEKLSYLHIFYIRQKRLVFFIH